MIDEHCEVDGRGSLRVTVQIYTNHSTYWDDCGWGYIRSGSRLDVRAYRSHHHWIAQPMQRWGWMMP